ncbi:MAG: outer-membrane lipoprotein carrier protein LolA [Paramuribaculum sp.]|nr:outer-membrane lipoprotein carrier protein LolA [Paramuribaculum sp.]
MEKVASKISSAPSIEADYILSSVADGSVAGTLVISGDKFKMTSPDITSWYDGTTQWTYVKSEQEVSVVTPTPEELAMVNPFIIINNFKKNYSVKTENTQNNTVKLSFTTKNKAAQIQMATITIDAASLLPKSIDLVMSDRRHVTILLSKINIGKKLPASFFRFDKTRYPNVEIIDLR